MKSSSGCPNTSYADVAKAALALKGRRVADDVSCTCAAAMLSALLIDVTSRAVDFYCLRSSRRFAVRAASVITVFFRISCLYFTIARIRKIITSKNDGIPKSYRIRGGYAEASSPGEKTVAVTRAPRGAPLRLFSPRDI